MQCPACQSEARKFGRDRKGNQRYQCLACRKLFADQPARPLGDMRLPLEKALVVLHHLVEGVSVRATVRLTGVSKKTVLELLELMGERCEKMLEGRISRLPVVDVQCDEIWGFVSMKEKTRLREFARLSPKAANLISDSKFLFRDAIIQLSAGITNSMSHTDL